MAVTSYDTRQLAVPFMNALNRAVQNNLVLSASFPYASAAALIAAASAITPTSPQMQEEQIRLFTADNAEFNVYNAAGMLTSVATAATLALARAAVQAYNSNVSTNQYSSHLGN
jgi:hypothetical protein